uniref:Uncharacterized protein n=1 Tax=Arundo donax TaxID=35708 RepID=A0A0A9H3V4_ARUDO
MVHRLHWREMSYLMKTM